MLSLPPMTFDPSYPATLRQIPFHRCGIHVEDLPVLHVASVMFEDGGDPDMLYMSTIPPYGIV